MAACDGVCTFVMGRVSSEEALPPGGNKNDSEGGQGGKVALSFLLKQKEAWCFIMITTPLCRVLYQTKRLLFKYVIEKTWHKSHDYFNRKINL